MLQTGKQKQFISDFYSAKPLTPDEVKTSKQADDEIEELLVVAKSFTSFHAPITKTHGWWCPFRLYD